VKCGGIILALRVPMTSIRAIVGGVIFMQRKIGITRVAKDCAKNINDLSTNEVFACPRSAKRPRYAALKKPLACIF